MNTLKRYFDPAAYIYNSFFEKFCEFTRFRIIPRVFNEAGALETRTFDERISPLLPRLIFNGYIQSYRVVRGCDGESWPLRASRVFLSAIRRESRARTSVGSVLPCRVTDDRLECIDGPCDRNRCVSRTFEDGDKTIYLFGHCIWRTSGILV